MLISNNQKTYTMTNQFRFRVLFSSVIMLVAIFIFYSCTKSEFSASGSDQQLSVFLTDHPADFDKVLVQINMVEVKLDTSSHKDDDSYGSRDNDNDDHRRGHDEYGQWDTLDVTPGNYDLLTLRNGVDTLLAQGRINGKARKIRITVGSVTVVKDSISYPVGLLSGDKNYIYVKIRDEHMQRNGNVQQLWLDFDVSRSIVEINGQYYLRPVLKPFCDKNSGELEGRVGPADAAAIVKVYNASDTATAIPDKKGEFRIRGLSEGDYTVLFDGSNGYQDTMITNIKITKGRDTKLQAVTMKK
jgi:ABC-type cobalt transport system substrate-binding protein